MKKIIWTWGLVAGVISILWPIVSEALSISNLSLQTRTIFGYATMILALSVIFVGIKNYGDTYNNGQITFGKALTIGLLITLIASTVYVVIWLIDFQYFVPDYGEKYQAQAIAELKASGASAAEIQKKATDITSMMAQYKASLTFRTLFTYLEIAPVGIVISLIAALILKNKPKPSTANL